MQVVTFYGGIAADNILSTVLKVVKIINVQKNYDKLVFMTRNLFINRCLTITFKKLRLSRFDIVVRCPMLFINGYFFLNDPCLYLIVPTNAF